MLLEVALHAAEQSTKLQAVRALGPDDIIGYRKLVLHFQQRGVDAGTNVREAGDVDAAVLMAFREEVQRGGLLRLPLHIRFPAACEAEARQVHDCRRKDAPVLNGSELIAGGSHFRPARRDGRSKERQRGIGEVAHVTEKQ